MPAPTITVWARVGRSATVEMMTERVARATPMLRHQQLADAPGRGGDPSERQTRKGRAPKAPPLTIARASAGARKPGLDGLLVRVDPGLCGLLGVRSLLDRQGDLVLVIGGPVEVRQEAVGGGVLALQGGAERLVQDVVGVVAVVSLGLGVVQRDVRALIG